MALAVFNLLRSGRGLSLYTLAVLLAVNLLNQLDRFLLAITARPQAQDLHFGDKGCLPVADADITANSSSSADLCSKLNESSCINNTQYACQWNYTGISIYPLMLLHLMSFHWHGMFQAKVTSINYWRAPSSFWCSLSLAWWKVLQPTILLDAHAWLWCSGFGPPWRCLLGWSKSTGSWPCCASAWVSVKPVAISLPHPWLLTYFLKIFAPQLLVYIIWEFTWATACRTRREISSPTPIFWVKAGDGSTIWVAHQDFCWCLSLCWQCRNHWTKSPPMTIAMTPGAVFCWYIFKSRNA